MRRLAQSFGVLVPAVLFAGLVAGVAVPAGAGETPAVTGEVEGKLVLVLDSSGSMAESSAGGGTKIEAAKQALTDVVDNLPDDAEVGMRVFGATVFSRGDKGACTDTQNVVPVGPLDREALKSEIASYKPYGETPIGNALKGAAEDLGDSGKRSIVLLSDGEPTCKPDPCKVARQLHQQGVELTINVVGLDVSGAARRALQCIAQAGGGTYYDVSDPEDLAGSLVSVSVRALREFSVQGTPVEGGTSPREALPLEPGQYTDHIGAGESARYYVIEKQPGWGLRAGVTARPASSDATLEGFEIGLDTLDGASCIDAFDDRANVLAERSIVSSGVAYIPEVSGVANEECTDARKLVLEVSYDESEIDKHYEMVIEPQPPVLDLDALPGPIADDDEYIEPARVSGDPEPVVGAPGFNAAPRLAPGVYSDTIRPGEQLLYRVPVGWGQAARVTITAEPDSRADELLGVVGNTMDVKSYTPFRQRMRALTYGADNARNGGSYDGQEPLAMSFVTVPIRLRNASEFNQTSTHSLAGDYWVSVSMGELDDDTRFAAPLTIEVELVGEPTSGPEFAQAATPSPSPSAEPSPSPADEETSAEAAPEDDEGSLLVPAVIGVVVVVAGVIGLGWVAMRRRAQ